MLRKAKVVGKFVEFHGAGAAPLPASRTAPRSPTWRPSTAPRWASSRSTRRPASILAATGRREEHIEAFRNYYQAQGMFGMPARDQCDYSTVLELDLATVKPSVAGPKRPQDRIDLDRLRAKWAELLEKPVAENGYAKTKDEIGRAFSAQIGVRGGALAKPISGRRAGSGEPPGPAKNTNAGTRSR
jgi:aconitate hydratase